MLSYAFVWGRCRVVVPLRLLRLLRLLRRVAGCRVAGFHCSALFETKSVPISKLAIEAATEQQM
jgi:hypothetical protein